MSSDPVRDYLVQIGRFALLTPEEEVKCGTAIQRYRSLESIKEVCKHQLGREISIAEWASVAQLSEGELERLLREGKRAIKRMYEGNLRLVVKVAKRFYRSKAGMEFLDLIQEGNLGLERAVALFDPTTGYKFSTYAYWWIRQGITRALTDKSRTIRLPVHVVEKDLKIRKAAHKLQLQLGRNPSISELAVEAKLKETAIRGCLAASNTKMMSFSMPTGKNEDSSLEELLPSLQYNPDQGADLSLREEAVLKLLDQLQAKEKAVIIHRFGLNQETPKTIRETARAMDCSIAVVKQKYRSAMNKLKAYCSKNHEFVELREMIDC